MYPSHLTNEKQTPSVTAFIFFISFLFVSVFLITSLVLATVLDHWHLEKQDAAEELVIHRGSGIIDAFNCTREISKGKIDPTQFLGLMRALDASK